MPKCEKCGEEYPEGTEHICLLQEEQKPEANVSSESGAKESKEEKIKPAEENQPQKAGDSDQEKK